MTNGRLPVNGLHALVELLGAAELPLAEDSPDDEDTADGRSDNDHDRDCSALLSRVTGLLERDGGGLFRGGGGSSLRDSLLA